MKYKKTLILFLSMAFLISPAFNYVNADTDTQTEITKSLASTIQGKENGFSYRIKDSKAYILSYDTKEEKVKNLTIPDKIKNYPVVEIRDNAF